MLLAKPAIEADNDFTMMYKIANEKIIPPSTKTPTEHSVWVKTDRFLLSWIKATITSSIQTIILPCSFAQEAWQLLTKRLSPLSKIHIRTLRDQLRSLKKTTPQVMIDYLLHAKSIFDSLLATGTPLSDSYLIEFVMDGLGSEFKEFITSLHFRSSTTFDDLFDLLIQEEQLMKHLVTSSKLRVS